MYIYSRHNIAYDRLCSTGIDFDVPSPYRFQQGASIQSSLVERRIPVDGADAQQLGTRIVGGEKKGVRIL